MHNSDFVRNHPDYGNPNHDNNEYHSGGSYNREFFPDSYNAVAQFQQSTGISLVQAQAQTNEQKQDMPDMWQLLVDFPLQEQEF